MGLLLVLGLVVLFGAIVILRATGFFRAFPLLLLLSGLSIYAYVIVGEHHPHAMAVLAACAVPVAIILPSLWRPASTKFTLWVADGVTGSAICAKWLGLAATVLTIGAAQFHLILWLEMCWWIVAIALAGWLVGTPNEPARARFDRQRAGRRRADDLAGQAR
jgi:hypothetical protein